MDVENSLLVRLAANGPTLSDAPVLLMAVVLVLALSGVVSQQRQSARDAADASDPDDKLQRRKLTRKLSNIGLSTLVTEVPSNLSIPVSVLTVEGHMTAADYVERLRARLPHDAFFLRWRSVVCGDYQTGVYKYVELPDYDVAQNVVEHTLGEGETIMSYVESALVNSPLDFDKPLWEMHVIHDPKGNPGVTSVGWKVHHCLGDGASLATAMAKLSDQSELFDAMLEKRAQAKKNPKAKKPRKPLSQTIKDVIVFLYVCFWSLYVISYHMFALVARREPATVFKRPGGKHKRLSYNMIYSVKTTKAVGKHFRATVNDVMLNVVAGAMRKTMLAVGDSVAPTLKVRCAIPVDMRSSTEVIRHTSNRFSSLVIDLPVGIEDSAERLHKVTAAMNEAKNSLEKYFVYWSSHLVSMLPAPLMRAIVHFTTGRMSVATSNVRASVVEMSLCKSQVSGFYGFVPPPPYVNLGVAILSMGDNLGLNVLVDPCVGINAKQFLDFAKEEFTALQESVAALEANTGEEKKTK
ncbi:acyltransferase ws dgat mgat family protein [Phytophthora cinnamomi]|uniref:acyltransferase ws dgat mgat family protein n=1 Tax=Phytophthora cinnamomi TaxID=4785 RepID=UPI0035593AEB|nr:acyltransferase ws dgat mgat family protein [Phytophthora cinnamomi]